MTPETPNETPKVYPSTRYHKTKKPVRVESPEHELEVAHPEKGWAETPAAFDEEHDDANDGDANDASAPSATAAADKPKRKR